MIDTSANVKNNYIVLVEDIKRRAYIHDHMSASAENILKIIKDRNEETDAPLRDQMQPWDIAFTDRGMPVMAVPAVIHGKNAIGYLTPFRAYRFQVSGTFDGCGDFGSTYVMNLKKYADEHDDRILCSLAELALYKAGCAHPHIKEYMKLDAFVALCISYLSQLDDSAVVAS